MTVARQNLQVRLAARPVGAPKPTDWSITHVEAVRLVKQSSEENVPGNAIASEVGFSLSHLQHLFRIHLGTSMRSYRTWCRFVTLAHATATGRSLTAGASTAGFFDSAHLTRSFNHTFGVPPTFVSGGEVKIHVVSASQEF